MFHLDTVWPGWGRPAEASCTGAGCAHR